MCIYIYVCIYICMYIYIYVCIYIYTCRTRVNMFSIASSFIHPTVTHTNHVRVITFGIACRP